MKAWICYVRHVWSHWVESMGTQRWSALFKKDLFPGLFALFSLADLILLVIRESTFWKNQGNKTQHLTPSLSAVTLSPIPVHTEPQRSTRQSCQRFKLEKHVCVHAPLCVFILHLSRSSRCLSHWTNHCKQEGSRKRRWTHRPVPAGLPTGPCKPCRTPLCGPFSPPLCNCLIPRGGAARVLSLEAPSYIIALHPHPPRLKATGRQASSSPMVPASLRCWSQFCWISEWMNAWHYYWLWQP